MENAEEERMKRGAKEVFIVSASRRTDIPAFYAEWFLRRLREGRAEYVHPYTKARIAVELDPARVAAIVFWTKDFAPLLTRVDEMERLGFGRWLVHYTITGLGPEWEPRVPSAEEAVMILRRLSERIGPERLYWRFDPLVFTGRLTVAATLARFERLCDRLHGFVTRCYTSVMAPYKKVEKRVAQYEIAYRDRMRALAGEELHELSGRMAAIGRPAGITVHACCAPELLGFGVQPARCLDAGLVLKLWPDCGLLPADGPSRRHCACHRAVDLGAYDTCPHRCLYCYANLSDRLISERFHCHRPEDLALIGEE